MDEYVKGWQDCIEAVRASLAEYPNGGGDIVILGHGDRLIGEAVGK